MLLSNYHTHTSRCGHASGEDEDYVLEALGHGYRYLGFSDHAMLPGFSEPYKRGEYSLFQDYVLSISSLKEKYKGQIEIYLGFEAESFPDYFPFYKELLDNHVLDYMILGNHMAMDRDKNIVARFANITSPSQLYLYKDLALKAISSHLFSIFAHPDYFMANIENFDSDCKKVSKEIIEACIAHDIPLEVNMAGIRTGKRMIGRKKRYIYPTDEFFQLVSKYKAKCVIGCDAHAPEQLSSDAGEFLAVEFAKKHNLVLVDKLDTIQQH